MIILALADLHTFNVRILNQIRSVTQYIDLITILGDVSESYFINLKEIFPGIPMVAILGNHDYPRVFDRYEYIQNVNGKVVDINGLKIGGIEGSYRYKNGNYPSMNQQESMILSYGMEKADILISHTSPFGLHEKDSDVHMGLMGIQTFLDSYNPRLNLHGHQHQTLYSYYGETAVIGIYGVALVDTDTCNSQIIVEE